jgi:hypothetical protein
MQKVGPWQPFSTTQYFRLSQWCSWRFKSMGHESSLPSFSAGANQCYDQYAAPSAEQIITVKMKAVRYSTILVPLYQTTVSLPRKPQQNSRCRTIPTFHMRYNSCTSIHVASFHPCCTELCAKLQWILPIHSANTQHNLYTIKPA